MKGNDKLIARMLFLEGRPVVDELRKITIGADLPRQLAGDQAAEADAIKAYNQATVLAGEAADFATREILEGILNDEGRHIDDIEELQDQMEHMSLPIFLTTRVG